MSYNRILTHKLVKYDVFKVTVQGVSWIRGVRQVRLAERSRASTNPIDSTTSRGRHAGRDHVDARRAPQNKPEYILLNYPEIPN